jgi:tRNA 2-thiouridine synthesizing protein D
LRRNHNVNVSPYEGAVALAFARLAPHANAVHGRDVAAEDHPNPKDWIAALLELAARQTPAIVSF